MLTLIIRTNVETPADRRRKIIEDASATVADILAKPEALYHGHPGT